jgi:uncharacterized protein with HEPN domain
MKKRDDTVYLGDILDAIRQIEICLEGIPYESFREDRMRRDAVVRQLEIIGEACRGLSKAFLARHPEIPWQDIIGMRHKIAHDYFIVDIRVVWDTAKNDLAPLKDQVEHILRDGDL